MAVDRDKVVRRIILEQRFAVFLKDPTLRNMGRVMNAMSLFIPTRYN